jgi:hypothetical protein
MRNFTKKKKSLTVAITSAVLMAGAGGAYAYWTSTGSGTATGTTAASLATLTTTQNGSVTAMAPGGAAQYVQFTINNSASSPQYVTAIAVTVSDITWVAAGTGSGDTLANHAIGDSAVTAGVCSSADFTIVNPTAGVDVTHSGLAFTSGSTPAAGTIAMNDPNSNQNGCKGVTVALALALT